MHIESIGISLLVFSCVICLILLLCVVTDEYKKEKLTRIFISLVCCHIPLMLVDITIFVYDGSGKPYAGLIFRAAYALSFAIGAVLLILFTYYLMTLIKTKTAVSRKAVYFSYAAIVLCLANIACVVLTQFNDMYYFIDNKNVFHYGSWYFLSQLLAILCIMINTGIMLTYRSRFGIRGLIFLFSYTVLPTMAIIVQNVVLEPIPAIDTAVTLMILIFYAGIQTEQIMQTKNKLTQSRAAIMLSQIQPHFLYNSLAAISRLCDKDPAQAKKATIEFSAYLRGNMDSLDEQKPILFEKELRHIEGFLTLEKAMYEDALNVVYNIKTKGFMLPVLSLQPIVENAVKHGIGKREGGGTITISTEETERAYLVIVSDDGMGFDCGSTRNDGQPHIGISNVRERLREQCGGRLEIESQKGIGTTATITIPKHGVKGAWRIENTRGR